MGIIPTIFSTAMAMVIAFVLGYVFIPSNQCDRLSHATNVIYGALGLPVYLGEKMIREDMTGEWQYVENATTFAHGMMAEYFKLEDCPSPDMALYGRKTGTASGDDWLKAHDPELYELMHQSFSTPDSDWKSGSP